MKVHRRPGSIVKTFLAAVALAALCLGCKNPLVSVARSLRAEASSPAISLTRGSTTITSGDVVDFGSVSTNGYRDITLTIGNYRGKSALSIDLDKVAYSLGENTEQSTFKVVTVSLGPIQAGGNATLAIRFSPSSISSKSASISIPTNDVNIPLIKLTLTGAGVAGAKEMTSFEIVSPLSAVGVIIDTEVSVAVPNGTDLSKLVASFESTGVSVYVGSNPQISGTTVNDFSNPVVYSVKAADGTSKSFTVTVTAAKNDAKALTAFSFPAYGVAATISGSSISATLPYGSSLSALVPSFSTTGASVSLAGKAQVSGVSANDFSSTLTYLVTAEDGSSREYLVTVTTALNPAKDLSSFSIAVSSSLSVAGVITGTSVAVTVPYGTSLASLVASFETTGASVKIGGVTQVSGTTANDFSKAVTYTVVAVDGTTKAYTVQVSASLSSSRDITSFTITSPSGSSATISNSGADTGSTIKVRIPYPNSAINIVAVFATSGASVATLGSTLSGTTTTILSSPQTYTVAAYDGSTKTYTATVTIDAVVPSLTTGSVSSIGTTTAAAGGAIVHSGGDGLAITDSGICWSTSSAPTTSDGCIHNGSAGSGASSISALTMTGLVPGTKYFVRAWAANSVGTGYGSPSSFWTLLETPSAPTATAIGDSSGSGKLAVSWTAMAGATAYDLYCSTASSAPSSPITSTSATSCQLSGLTDFATHYLWLVSRSASPVASPMSAAATCFPGVHVTGLVLPSTLRLLSGTTDQLTATVSPSNATNQTLTWSSSNTAVAAVSSSGLVTAGNTAGTATITAKAQAPDDSLQASCQVMVPSVTIGAQSGSIYSGFAGTATFAVSTVNVSEGNAGTVSWYANAAGTATASAPTGISAAVSAVSSSAATVTMGIAASAVAGTYYFALTEGDVSSAVTALTVLQPSISLAAQSGSVYSGFAGTATFAASTVNVPAGSAGTIAWYANAAGTTATSAPSGVSAAVSAISASSATVTMSATTAAAAGTYYFTLTEGATSSGVAALTILQPSVSLAAQSGTIGSGTAGTASYATTTANVPSGTSGSVTWYTNAAGTTSTTAPVGVAVSVTSVSNNAATLTMTGSNLSLAGTYYFRLGMGSNLSLATALTITFASYNSTVLTPANLGGGDQLTMIAVPGGTFSRDGGTTNLSTVSSFHMSKYAVTGEQFNYLSGTDPSKFSGVSNNPAECVSFYKAIWFCNKLSLSEGKTPAYTVSGVSFSTLAYGSVPTSENDVWDAATVDTSVNGYRLPTEMEYVWAMLGGLSDTRSGDLVSGINRYGYSKAYAGSQESGSAKASIGNYAWYNSNAGGTTHSVGTKLPNELGLYDLSGNVMSWCWGWSLNSGIGTSVWPSGQLTDWQGASSGNYRCLKAGYWYEGDYRCSPTYQWIDPWSGGDGTGVRLVSR